ncbi:trichohyalin-like [Vespula squamosa]|uniref:Trichohyalin-like n=1 Tax=Vespula squamosa TaxID=30214 RepID=A0ABD2A9Z8_VESSQ
MIFCFLKDTKPGKELDYLLVRANSWSGKPVYIELWQPKELFTIRQRQTPSQTRGVITLIGELDFETQSMYTLTMYATDPYTEPGKDTRNIAGLNVVVVVQDVQDVPPIFTLAPPLTRLNNSIQPGDVILRVHAEDGDKGVPREIVYGLVSEGNPFTPFFNISETTGEIVLARPLEELVQITHVGAPVVLSVVAEEIRRTREEPPAQATVVEVGLLLGEPGNSPPYFESDTYVTVIDENLEPGTIITFGDQYSTKVRDEDIGKAGVFALKLENNNGTFEINPTVAERTADFIITVRDNTFIDYETYKSLIFKIIAQEIGPATNLSTSVPVTIYLRDINDNPPVFEQDSYEVTLSENVTAGTRVVQVHATDKDTGDFGNIQYTQIIGQGSEAFTMDSDRGLITVAMGSSLDREVASRLQLSVEARDENGKGNRGVVPLIVNLIDVNDNVPIFEKSIYMFFLNSDLTNFTSSAIIKATDADAEPPNNVIRYEIIHGNYEDKFYLNEITGELILRSPITKVRRKKQSTAERLGNKSRKELHRDDTKEIILQAINTTATNLRISRPFERSELLKKIRESVKTRRKRADDDALYTLTARAYDLGVPHLSSLTQIRIMSGGVAEDRIVTFVLPEEHPDPVKTAKTLATITGAKVIVQDIRPYVATNDTSNMSSDAKKSIVVARVEKSTSFVDIEKIRETLAANGVGIINASVMMPDSTGKTTITNITNTVTNVQNKEVITVKAENKILFWLLIILGLLMLLAIAALIICCICPGCPFYMAPRKRRVQSSETLIVRSDGRPKRHLHRKQPTIVHVTNNQERKQAWSADPTRRNWQFNRRNVKNCGLSSLPGDVAYVSAHANEGRMNAESSRQRDDLIYDNSRRITGQDRMYVEDIESIKMRDYNMDDGVDSLQRDDIERGSDHPRQSYRYEQEQDINDDRTIREQHFYREGNAEILRLVTRGGQADDNVIQHHGTTVIVDGKDILLKRFMEDQKMRQEASIQDIEGTRSIESTQRIRETSHQQPEIILIPQTLNIAHGQHVDESGPGVQRLLIDRIDYEDTPKEKVTHISDNVQTTRQESTIVGGGGGASESTERPTILNKDNVQSVNVQSYSFHDMELARQNALLTRLLLERETRAGSGPAMMDSTSYLETQSLPGQVAIATQTDRTAATQTERHVRSRSDNDESEDESRIRKKMKTKKRYESDSKRTRTLWMKSPIEEERSPCFDKRLSILRKKVKEVKDGRKISIEPEVLREISDSLDDNGSSGKGDDKETKTYERSTEETSIRYEILNEEDNGSPSSIEISKDNFDKVFGEKAHHRDRDDRKTDVTESTSSSELKEKTEKHTEKQTTSPKKEAKKSQKKTESKPTFRILEREITLLTKKLSKLGEKKTQEKDSGSASTFQERTTTTTTKKSLKKDVDQKMSKRMEDSSKHRTKISTEPTLSTSRATEQGTNQRKEGSITKLRHKLKYQQVQVTSTGSSEIEDTHERSRKECSESNQENVKEKQLSTIHSKIKRQSHIEDQKENLVLKDQECEKQKEFSKEHSKFDSKFKKLDKSISHSQKESLSEEFSTSTGSDRMEIKKELGPRRNFDKRTSTSSSDNVSKQTGQRKSKKMRVQHQAGKISDISLKDTSEKEDTEKRKMSADDKNIKKKSKLVKVHTDGKKKVSTVKSDLESTKEDDRMMSLREALKDFVGFGRIKKDTSEEQAFTDNFEEIPKEIVTSSQESDKIKIEEKVTSKLETKSPEELIKYSTDPRDTEKEQVEKSENDRDQKIEIVEVPSEDIEKDTKPKIKEDKNAFEIRETDERSVDKKKTVEEFIEELQKEIYRSRISDKEKSEIAITSSVSPIDKILSKTAIIPSTSKDIIHEKVSSPDMADKIDFKDGTEVTKKEDETTTRKDIEKSFETKNKDDSSVKDSKTITMLVDIKKEQKSFDQSTKVDSETTTEIIDKDSQVTLSKDDDKVKKTEDKPSSSKTVHDKDTKKDDAKDVKKDTKDTSITTEDPSSLMDTTKMIETVLEIASKRSLPEESDMDEKFELKEMADVKSEKDYAYIKSPKIDTIVKSNGKRDSILVSAEVHAGQITEEIVDDSRDTDKSKEILIAQQDKDKIDISVSTEDTKSFIKESQVRTSPVKDILKSLKTKDTEITAEKDKPVEDIKQSNINVEDEGREKSKIKIEDTILKKEEGETVSQKDEIDIKRDESDKGKEKLETTSIELSEDNDDGKKDIKSEPLKDEATKDLTSPQDTETHEKQKLEEIKITSSPPTKPALPILSDMEDRSTSQGEQIEMKIIQESKDSTDETNPIDPMRVEKPSKPPSPTKILEPSSPQEESKIQTDTMDIDKEKESRSFDAISVIKSLEELKFDEITQSRTKDKDFSEKETTVLLEDKDNQGSIIKLEEEEDQKEKEDPSKQDKFVRESPDETSLQPGEEFAKEELLKSSTEEYENVSPTIFTSIIDTPEDSDESDSSSDISRKTTLTTRPYQTPRHRAKDDPEKETLSMEMTESVSDIEDMELTIEKSKDENGEHQVIDVTMDVIKKLPTVSRETMETEKNGSIDKDIEIDEKSKETIFTEKSSLPIPEASSIVTENQEKESSSKKPKDIKDTENTKTTKVKDDSKTEKHDKSEESKDKQVKKLEKDIKGGKQHPERSKVAARKEKKNISEEVIEIKKDPSVRKTFRQFKRRPSKSTGSQPDKHSEKKSEDEKVTAKSKKAEEDRSKSKKSASSGEKSSSPPKTGDTDKTGETGKTRSKYMAWYTQKREEMERKREAKKTEEHDEQDQQLPRWLRRSLAHRRSIPDEKKKLEMKTPEITPRTRRKVKPLVNVESEQLKAIVRQGRRMRKAEGGQYEDPPIQIFASTPPAPSPQPPPTLTESKYPRHHLFQHSEYKYEKMPAPFYLHPPPAPHPSPQLSPEHYDSQRTTEFVRPEVELDSGTGASITTGTRLRHQQLLEKKSVFDIAYSEAAPSQLRSDSATPPS